MLQTQRKMTSYSSLCRFISILDGVCISCTGSVWRVAQLLASCSNARIVKALGRPNMCICRLMYSRLVVGVPVCNVIRL